jgi:hypothetical protein
MSEHRTPDTLSTQAENEIICEKLLGWKRVSSTATRSAYWREPSGGERLNTPTFTSWAEAGLILEALRARGLVCELQAREKEYWFGICWPISDNYVYDCREDTGPLAIRTAALVFIRSQS